MHANGAREQGSQVGRWAAEQTAEKAPDSARIGASWLLEVARWGHHTVSWVYVVAAAKVGTPCVHAWPGQCPIASPCA